MAKLITWKIVNLTPPLRISHCMNITNIICQNSQNRQINFTEFSELVIDKNRVCVSAVGSADFSLVNNPISLYIRQSPLTVKKRTQKWILSKQLISFFPSLGGQQPIFCHAINNKIINIWQRSLQESYKGMKILYKSR
jgi:ABC-type glucose/galactose transport system permease subunit